MEIAIKLDQASDHKVHLLVDRKIGCSKFPVYHGKAISQDLHFALKVYSQNHSNNCYQREKIIISQLNHTNIISYIPIASHSLKDNMILLEYAQNGSLFDHIRTRGTLSEKVARTYFRQLVDALEHMHRKNIAHLDLKLENLLLDKNFTIKVSDFDQSQKAEEKRLKSGGTPCYRAPEVISNTCQNFFSADIYSLGVILFGMMTGEYLFIETKNGNNQELKYYDSFCHNNAEFWKLKSSSRNHTVFSQEFKELINGMCASSPMSRFTLKELKASKWYNKEIFDKNQLKLQMEGNL